MKKVKQNASTCFTHFRQVEALIIDFHSFLGPQIDERFIFSTVTHDTLLKIVTKLKLKNSAGPDNISTKVLKLILPTISLPLCHLFNLSLQTGFVPHQLKTAKVVPVFKSGDKHNFTNYRPISLLSSFAKLLEKIVAHQVIGFLHKILPVRIGLIFNPSAKGDKARHLRKQLDEIQGECTLLPTEGPGHAEDLAEQALQPTNVDRSQPLAPRSHSGAEQRHHCAPILSARQGPKSKATLEK